MYCTCLGGEASGRDVFGLQRVLAAGRKPATPPGASRPVSRHRTGHRRITFGKPAGALPSRGEFIVRGAWVLTMDPALGDFPDGDLHVRDGVIVAVGRNLDAPGVAVIDARDMIAMPGFIDTHVHYPQTDIIASHGKRLLDWLNDYTFPAEAAFADPVHAGAVAEFFLDELLRNGTTTAAVYPTVHKQSVDAFFAGAQRRRLRMLCGKVMMDRNCPDNLRDIDAETSYRECQELIARWHGRAVRSRYP